jgi:hypothetical protein
MAAVAAVTGLHCELGGLGRPITAMQSLFAGVLGLPATGVTPDRAVQAFGWIACWNYRCDGVLQCAFRLHMLYVTTGASKGGPLHDEALLIYSTD